MKEGDAAHLDLEAYLRRIEYMCARRKLSAPR
jgi:hypothetical protein